MSMVCELRQIESSDIGPLLADPERIDEILDWDEDEEDDESRSEPYLDLDKSWHAIHYLLTGSAWEGEPPLSYLLIGGEEVGDIDVGYGPARVLRPDEVRTFDGALSSISADDLRRRFDPKAMMKEDIYPNIWDRDLQQDDVLGYVLDNYQGLQAFVHDASAKGKGLLIYMT